MNEIIRSDKDKKYRIEMLDKSIKVIDCIFENDSMTFMEIQKKINISKASLHRILYTLEQSDYLEKDRDTDVYRLGKLFAFYGIKVRSSMTITSICEPFMKNLANELGESVNLNIEYDSRVLCLLSFKGESSVISSTLMPISPLNCSASGKLFLLSKTDKELKEYFDSELPEYRTVNSIMSYESYCKERENILEKEVSYDVEEYEYGLFCISIPLKNHQGRLNLNVSISGPRTRMEMKGIDMLEEKLRSTVESISYILKNIQYSQSQRRL
ncbi:IclR family transcriptional regulator [Filifactor villosus]|uniref:IclR family transcriptional regulator n=1 Tax=Filifactor villosus TaxID=29374 RepID=A0ABV9QM99_9FIRM